MKLCSACNKKKKESQFNKKGDRLQAKCRPCQRDWFRSYYTGEAADRHRKQVRKRNRRIAADNRVLLDSLKAGKPCVDCDRLWNPWQMDFDHVRGKKLFNVSESGGWKTREQILKEVAKCELVCSNCHRDRTHSRMV